LGDVEVLGGTVEVTAGSDLQKRSNMRDSHDGSVAIGVLEPIGLLNNVMQKKYNEVQKKSLFK